ncbi:glycosyltransferase family 92 protein RCOM_0530710 [Selaginella moellendorffii]|nr:glycosyltransferase family 92 protein RCOM_0530710 [Selaginella moellendorffii]|eukprot:XP_002974979.2 glycosyltransferase family 92 protein RCOM_0530710 [Selaginella moellendorffii]
MKSRGGHSSWRKIVYGGVLALAIIALLAMRPGSESRDVGEFLPREIRGEANKVVKEIVEESAINSRIDHIVSLPDNEFLFIVSRSSARDERIVKDLAKGHCYLRIPSGPRPIAARIVDNLSGDGGRRMIRCRAIDQQLPLQSPLVATAQIQSSDGKITLGSRGRSLELVNWNRIVFAALAREEDLVLFTKGIFSVKKENPPKHARCVFYTDNGVAVTYTRVLGIAQEVIRCEYPPGQGISRGSLVSVVPGEGTGGDAAAPSVAVYGGAAREGQSARPRHLLCACTMVRNAAKFLREWMLYHSHLGIEKFVLYDNNSEDGLEEAAAELRNRDGLAVEIVPWPWIKSQEAGFSHCAASRRDECQWMAFVDVDEFLFPKLWLHSGAKSTNATGTVGSSPLARAIAAATRNRSQMVGQISFRCRDFGPSGQATHPTAGVTQGYTCRVVKEQRHKSLVRLEAVDRGLVNVVHHFTLGQRYATARMPSWKGVVNHYKFQAWDEFKQKFERRVSAYVSDWKEERNIKSQDRTPGLGSKADKPADWERRFCEVQDTALRDYILKTMASPDKLELPWQS